jgi:hypothetical protein
MWNTNEPPPLRVCVCVCRLESALEEVKVEEDKLNALGTEEQRQKELSRLRSVLTAVQQSWPQLTA